MCSTANPRSVEIPPAACEAALGERLCWSLGELTRIEISWEPERAES